MKVESVLVTGANRGIGLEFVKQIVKLPQPPHFVFATYRNEDTTQALKEIRDTSKESQVELIKMDVTKKDDTESARKFLESKLGDGGLTLLINNAATLKGQSFIEVTEENMVNHFATNTMGPVMILKTALNMAMRVIALTVKDQGILIVNIYPGYVKKSMRSERAQLTTEESISAMLKTLSKLNESHLGTFLNRHGKPIPF